MSHHTVGGLPARMNMRLVEPLREAQFARIVRRIRAGGMVKRGGKLRREAPLPQEMQGRWVIVDDEPSELIVDGGEITCFGARVEYDYKEIKKLDGALMVNLEIDDVSQEYDFQRRHLTNLIITPGGKFFVYNVKFVSEFARPKA
jgi:hypothetical protein